MSGIGKDLPIELQSEIPTWSAGMAFDTGDVVFGPDDNIYKAVTSHISTGSFTSDYSEGKWSIKKAGSTALEVASAGVVPINDTLTVYGGLTLSLDDGVWLIHANATLTGLTSDKGTVAIFQGGVEITITTRIFGTSSAASINNSDTISTQSLVTISGGPESVDFRAKRNSPTGDVNWHCGSIIGSE